MVYKLLKFVFTFGVHGYFRKVEVAHADRIPNNGPILFVANHTSSFLDGVILTILLKRELHFLTRGETFKSKLVKLIFSWMNMIPVYRPEITPDKVVQNKDVFNKCFEHLASGKCILIFPEGFSVTERKIRPLKTGAARITLGAEALNGFSLGIKIIPIGINYSDSHRFRSHLFLNIGEPIDISSYKSSYLKDQKKTVRTLTAEIKKALEVNTIVIPEKDSENLIHQLNNIVDNSSIETTPNQRKYLSSKFHTIKKLTALVDHLVQNDTEGLDDLKRSINDYMAILNKHRLKLWLLNKNYNKKTLRNKTFRLIWTFPLYIIGFSFNIIPFKIAEFISDKSIKRPDFRGSMQLSFGVLFHLVFYIFFSILVKNIAGLIFGILFFLSLYPLGLVCVNYIRRFKELQSILHFNKFQNKNPEIVQGLKEAKSMIIQKLKAKIEEIKQPEKILL